MQAKRGAMVEWLEQLDYGAETREFEAGLCLPMTGKLSLATQHWMGTFFELRQWKERDGLHLSSAVSQETVGHSNPTAAMGNLHLLGQAHLTHIQTAKIQTDPYFWTI